MNAPSHLYDILNNKVISPVKEAKRIGWILFKDSFFTSNYNRVILRDYLAPDFRYMKCRGTFVNINEFLEETLPSVEMSPFTIDHLAVYCEVIENLLNLPLKGMEDEAVFRILQIRENIDIVLEKTGYKFIDKDGILYATRKDQAVDEAIEHIRDDQVALDVLEYNRVSLKGNLARKKEILASFGLYAEQIFKSPKFADQFKQLRSDVGFCLNNLNIRHNQVANKVSQRVLQGMTEEELEQWYDRTYTLLISVVLMNTTRDIQTQLELLKQKAGNPNG